MKYKLSVGTPLMESVEQYKYLKWASSAGFGAVECEIAHPYDLNVRNILKKGLKKYNLGFSGIRSGVSYVQEGLCMCSSDENIRNGAVKRLIACNELVATYPGALNLIGMMQGVLKDMSKFDEARKNIIDSLKLVSKSAADLGIKISLEPVNHNIVNYNNTVDEISAIIDEIGNPALGILLDTYHMHMEEKSILASLIRAKDKVNHIHVADSNRQYPGSCKIDFPAFFDVLNSIDYEGWITVEALEKPDFKTMAERSMLYLKECGL